MKASSYRPTIARLLFPAPYSSLFLSPFLARKILWEKETAIAVNLSRSDFSSNSLIIGLVQPTLGEKLKRSIEINNVIYFNFR